MWPSGTCAVGGSASAPAPAPALVPAPARAPVPARARGSVPAPALAGAGRGGDGGQATVLVAAAVALAVVALVALAPMGRALAQRAQARTAADAAALAGAAEGQEAAERLAVDNGGRLLAFRRGDDGEVVVRVAVGDVDAWARARGRQVAPIAPVRPGAGSAPSGAGGHGPGASGSRAGLAPAMLAALERADRLLGRPVPVASGLRTREQQQALWDRRHTNPYPVARPGTSDHESGLAIDVPRGMVPSVLTVAGEAGLCRPLPQSDPVHFVVCGR
jgi:hypothetical protein